MYGDHEERGEDIGDQGECKTAPEAAAAGRHLRDAEHETRSSARRRSLAYQPADRARGARARPPGPPPEHTNMFFTIYFAMTGLHGIHVLVGVFVFIWLLIRAIKGHFTPDYFGPVDFAALYWHIVDLIWIFLFPLLYLIH